MGSTNAARRRVQEQARPPDAAAVLAELGRINAEGDAIHRRMRRLDAEVSRVTARLDELAQGDDGDRFALLADKLASRLAVLVTELMADAAHCEESRRQAEALAPLLAFTPAMFEAAVLEGRRREAEERDQAPRARPRARHAKRHLKGLPGITAAAGVVVAAGLGGSIAVSMHDESSVSAVAAVPARHAALQRMAPDRAALVPSWSPQARFSPPPRPSPAAASASPAPTVTPGLPFPQLPAGAPASSPPPPVQVPGPSLLVSARNLELSGPAGTFTITAQDGTVDWWVSTDIPGASVRTQAGGRQGVLSPAQEPVTITVTNPSGEPGFVYVKWPDGGIASVWVTPSAGTPVLALPSGPESPAS